MNPKPNLRILVVGAGPTGLSAGLELARQGVIPEIVERRSEPSLLSRAVGILPETVDKWNDSGVTEAIRREAMPFRKFRFFRGSKLLMKLDFSAEEFRDRVVMGLPQNRTEEILREGLERRGGSVTFGREVVSVEPNEAGATVGFGDGDRQTYDWVIAADGVRSVVREALGIAYEGFDLDDEWSVADVDVEGYDPEGFTAWIQESPGEFALVLPIEAKRVRIAASTSDALKTIPFPFEITHVRRTGVFQIAVRQAETYRKGRVLLAGDAAHCHSPVGGRGMNLGVDDAVAAANAILHGTVDDYSAERHAIGRDVLNLSEQGRKLVCAISPMIQVGTTLAMALIQRLPFLHRAFLKRLTTLG